MIHPPIHGFIAWAPERTVQLRLSREAMWVRQQEAALKPKRQTKAKHALSTKPSKPKPLPAAFGGLSPELQALLLGVKK